MARGRTNTKKMPRQVGQVSSNKFAVLALSEDPWQDIHPKVCTICSKTGHTDEEHAAIPNPDAKMTIESLPAELRLDILSRLPVSDIQRCLGVSKDFQELIEVQANKIALLAAARERFTQQCLEDVEYFMGLTPEPNLLRFLFTFLSRRGLWKDETKTHIMIRRAVFQWAINCSPKFRKLARFGHLSVPLPLYDYLSKIGELLVQTYMDLHCRKRPTVSGFAAPKMKHVPNLRQFLKHVDTPERRAGSLVDLNHLVYELGLPLSREQMGQWYIDIHEYREPALPAYPSPVKDNSDRHGLLRIPTQGDPALDCPQFAVTEIMAWKQIPGRDKWHHSGGCCNTKTLSRILGVRFPKLQPGVGICARTKWAQDLIRQAKRRKTMVLTEEQKVAVLEQLYLW